MCHIAWCDFSWEAFATLMTGLAAVAGAYTIARRQMKILEHQTMVERLKLRSDTFQKRWEVYEATVLWLQDWYQSGDRPSDLVSSDFYWALEKAKFVFRPEVSMKMDDWRMAANRLKLINRKMEGDVDEGDRQKLSEDAAEIARTLESAFREIVPLFAEEMSFDDTIGGLPRIPTPPREVNP